MFSFIARVVQAGLAPSPVRVCARVCAIGASGSYTLSCWPGHALGCCQRVPFAITLHTKASLEPHLFRAVLKRLFGLLLWCRAAPIRAALERPPAPATALSTPRTDTPASSDIEAAQTGAGKHFNRATFFFFFLAPGTVLLACVICVTPSYTCARCCNRTRFAFTLLLAAACGCGWVDTPTNKVVKRPKFELDSNLKVRLSLSPPHPCDSSLVFTNMAEIEIKRAAKYCCLSFSHVLLVLLPFYSSLCD